LHFLFSFFKKNIQNNNYGSDVHSEKKQRKKKEGVNQQMVDNRKEQLFAKSFSLWFCELFPCCSTLFRFFSSVIGAILVILQFLSLLWLSTMTFIKWALSSLCHFPFFSFIIILQLPWIVILGDLAPPMLFLFIYIVWWCKW
jgi:hypothetical protein